MNSVLIVSHKGGKETSLQDILQKGFQRQGRETGALNQAKAIEEEEAKKDIGIQEITIMKEGINVVSVKVESTAQIEVKEETLHTIDMEGETME